MNLLRLSADHLVQYKQLMLHGYKETPEVFTSTFLERAAVPDEWWLKRLGATDLFVTLGAFSNSALVGATGVEFGAREKILHKAKLIGMYVSPDHRRRGIGLRLLQRAVDFVEVQSGITVVTLTVTVTNAAAIRLYESAGFKTFGVEPRAIRVNDQYFEKCHMYLEL